MRTVKLDHFLANPPRLGTYSLIVEKAANSDHVQLAIRRNYWSKKKRNNVVTVKHLGSAYKEQLIRLANELIATANFT